MERVRVVWSALPDGDDVVGDILKEGNCIVTGDEF